MGKTKIIVIYDGSCGFCTRGITWLKRFDWLNKFNNIPYQEGSLYWTYPTLNQAACAEALHLLFPDGRLVAGADALREIFLRVPLAIPFGLLMSIRPLQPLLRKLYAVLARNRYRFGGRCDPQGRNS